MHCYSVPHFIRQQIPTTENNFSFKLELAFLYFIQQFRKIYIGDHAINSSKVRVYASFCENTIDLYKTK